MASGEITLTQLRALVAVQKHGSITAAATALRLTQPVLTRCLRQLEQQLGVALLHRSARGATLTGYGEVLVARALRIDEEVRRAQDEIRMNSGRTGSTSPSGRSPSAASGASTRARSCWRSSWWSPCAVDMPGPVRDPSGRCRTRGGW